MRWFTSDEHYFHKNIITYSKRPFRDVPEMNEEMIRRHNAVVGPQDEVWHLGDFVMKGDPGDILSQLNGRHHLVSGNHDKCHPKHSRAARATREYLAAGFLSVQERTTLTLDGFGRVLLCHMPIRRMDLDDEAKRDVKYLEYRPTPDEVRESAPKTDILLHGHVHEKWLRLKGMINVGVDQWDFFPVSEAELVTFIRSGKTSHK
jgi:calcineurin-like phosphoesterase family protein